jgi:predicted GNAT family acetyltransferase
MKRAPPRNCRIATTVTPSGLRGRGCATTGATSFSAPHS